MKNDPQENLNQESEKSSGVASGGDKILEIKESEYKKLIEEVVLYKDKFVRLFADFENVRKRFERDRIEFVKYANEDLLVEFLGILDNLERSVEAAQAKHEDYTAFLKGVEMIMAQIHELLTKNNVTTIEAKGKKFDPHAHEVLLQEERDDVEDGIVIEEFQKGYFLGEKVIRTAKVKVAKQK